MTNSPVCDRRDQALTGLKALLDTRLTEAEWSQIHSDLSALASEPFGTTLEAMDPWWLNPSVETLLLRVRGTRKWRKASEESTTPPLATYELINRMIHTLSIDGMIEKSPLSQTPPADPTKGNHEPA